jgi:hypothetical protein
MNPAPGLFEISLTATRPHCRRLNPVSTNFGSPPEDRLTNAISRHDHRTPASGQGRRSTAPMFYDPEIPTPGWEIFQDPNAEENFEAMPPQPRNMTPVMGGPAEPPFQTRVFVTTPQGEEDASSSSSSDAPSPGHRADPVDDEASRVMLDRIIRTLTTVQADNRRRQRRRRRRLLREGRIEEELAGLQADDDGMVGRMQERYAELTFLEEGYDPRYEQRVRRRQRPAQAQNRGLEQELTESPAGDAEQRQHDRLTQQDMESPAEQGRDQLNVPSEIQGGIMEEQRMDSSEVTIASPFGPIPALTSASTSTPSSAPPATSQSTSAMRAPSPSPQAAIMGSGPPFAERARSRGRNMGMTVHEDSEGTGDREAEADGAEHTNTSPTINPPTSTLTAPMSLNPGSEEAQIAQVTTTNTTPTITHSTPSPPSTSS